MEDYLNPGSILLGIPYEQWLKHRNKRVIHLWRLKGTLPGMVGAPKKVRISRRSWWFLMHRCRKPKHIPGKPITRMHRAYLRKSIACLNARLLDDRIEFTHEVRRIIKKDIDQCEELLRRPLRQPKSSDWRKKVHPLKAMVEGFNRKHRMDAYELNPEKLKRKPQGEIGKDGWFCEYSLFYANGSPVLASYCGHRMTNSCYEEIDKTGASIYSWCNWGGMGKCEGEQLSGLRRTQRRAKKAGLRYPIRWW